MTNLTDADGLTQELVDVAVGDTRTQLPAGITPRQRRRRRRVEAAERWRRCVAADRPAWLSALFVVPVFLAPPPDQHERHHADSTISAA